MTQSPFAAPASTTGIDYATVLGSLLIVKPLEVAKDVNTTLGVKDAIRADVYVVDGPLAGTEYVQTLIFPSVLQGQLRPNLGKMVLGRLGQGVAKPKQDPPWLLLDPTPADTAQGVDYLNRRGGNQFSAPAQQAPQQPQYQQPPQQGYAPPQQQQPQYQPPQQPQYGPPQGAPVSTDQPPF